MDAVSFRDDERSQDVDNIMLTGEQDPEKQSMYNNSPVRNGRKYYASLFGKYKLFIIAGIFLLFFTISLTTGIALSRPEQTSTQSSSSSATENLVDVDSVIGKEENMWKEPMNSKRDWNGETPVTNNGGGSESFGFGASTASQVGTARIGGAEANGATTASSTTTDSMEFLDVLERTFNEMKFPDQHFLNFNSNQSPQSQALLWMIENDKEYSTNEQLSDQRKLQRYALASFFYSTYAVTHPYLDSQLPWKSADKWLSNFNECEWEGITCDPNVNNGKSITSIVLADNRISGTPPLDLGLLGSTLETLVLSTNLLYMDGVHLELFGFLKNLKDLKIDDNYVSSKSGLPLSLQNLEKLERVVLSYNLLQGQIPSNYFDNLSKLSHLEFESNYISGELPSSLLESESLVYLYMRRNNVGMKFDELVKAANWPKIFSLWFDNNDFSGTIPSEIGLMTGLASLSMTNATVTGTIPSEIGQLNELRRLWLYNNKLSGTIPSELGDKLQSLEVVELYDNDLTGAVPSNLCTTIEKSPYKFKELAADCHKVECSSCCTKCY